MKWIAALYLLIIITRSIVKAENLDQDNLHHPDEKDDDSVEVSEPKFDENHGNTSFYDHGYDEIDSQEQVSNLLANNQVVNQSSVGDDDADWLEDLAIEGLLNHDIKGLGGDFINSTLDENKDADYIDMDDLNVTLVDELILTEEFLAGELGLGQSENEVISVPNVADVQTSSTTGSLYEFSTNAEEMTPSALVGSQEKEDSSPKIEDDAKLEPEPLVDFTADKAVTASIIESTTFISEPPAEADISSTDETTAVIDDNLVDAVTESKVDPTSAISEKPDEEVTISTVKQSDLVSEPPAEAVTGSKVSNTEPPDQQTDATEASDAPTVQTSEQPGTASTLESDDDTFKYKISGSDHLENCNCECGSKFAYALGEESSQSDSEKEQLVDIVLANENVRICSGLEIERCCVDFQFEGLDSDPRFKFPEVDPEEQTLVGPNGIPHSCSPFLKTAEERCASRVDTVEVKLDNCQSTLNQSMISTTKTEDIFLELELAEMNTEFVASEILEANAIWKVNINASERSQLVIQPSSRDVLPILGKLDKEPNLKDFDIFDRLDGPSRQSIELDLTSGLWYFFIINEEAYEQEVLLSFKKGKTEFDDEECIDCYSLFGIKVDKDLDIECGNGTYRNGQCQCTDGFFGAKCNISAEDCAKAHCEDKGSCVWTQDAFGHSRVSCECEKGFTGEHCEINECLDCENGLCGPEGSCICYSGWAGSQCNSKVDHISETVCPMSLAPAPVPCEPECGEHGLCKSGHCVCEPGWGGNDCGTKICDARCSLHGLCVDGHCVCSPGWGGLHCTLDLCPRACSGHGRCVNGTVNSAMTWRCTCDAGWFGSDCSVPIETVCDDNIDNDEDGLIDCKDPECCWSEACSQKMSCLSYPDPKSRLSETVEPFETFFERNKFLIADGSVQRDITLKAFSPSQVSVIRGRVTTQSGVPVKGVRVVSSRFLGYTLTGADGWYDMLVNGGGIVNLKFGKGGGFARETLDAYVPCNQIVVVKDIKLSLDQKLSKAGQADQHSPKPDTAAWCEEHRPGLLPTGIKVSSINNPEDGLFKHIPLTSTNVKLSYASKRTNGYKPLISLDLVGEFLPPSLLTVRTRIAVEGRLFESIHEADRNLTYDFVWDRIDAYGRKVYGKTIAHVSLGYQYKLCQGLVWTSQMVQLHGFIPPTISIMGWSLDIHHRYNPRDGIVYKGDGSILDLSEEKDVLVTAINQNFTKTVIGPRAVETDGKGNIYIGDSEFIRKFNEVGRGVELLKLNATTSLKRYYLAINNDGSYLYMSDPANYRIIRIPIPSEDGQQPTDNSSANHDLLSTNYETIIGGSDDLACLINDVDECGDNGPPNMAKITYPKGLAFDHAGNLIFVDGVTLRVIQFDTKNKAVTVRRVAGARKITSEWIPAPIDCRSIVKDGPEANFNWPTDLARDPITPGRLAVIDMGNVYAVQLRGEGADVAASVEHWMTVNIEAVDASGSQVPEKCRIDRLDFVPRHVAFSSLGRLILGDEQNRIFIERENKSQGPVKMLAGSLAYCKRNVGGCLRSDFEDVSTIGTKARFFQVGDIAAHHNGDIIVVDQKRHQVRSIKSYVPLSDSGDRDNFHIVSADNQQIWIFDQYGRHQRTDGLYASVVSGYSFLYNAAGNLAEVQDRMDRALVLNWTDDGALLQGITTPKGAVYRTKVGGSKVGPMEKTLDTLWTPDNMVYVFSYSRDAGERSSSGARSLGSLSNGLLNKMFIGGTLQVLFKYQSETGSFVSAEVPIQDSMVVTDMDAVGQTHPSRLYRTGDNVLLKELYPEEFLLHSTVIGEDVVTALAPVEAENDTIKESHHTSPEVLLLHRTHWDLFVHSSSSKSGRKRPTNFGLSVDGLGKRFVLNEADNRPVFTSELHPRNMVRSVYDPSGKQLLKIEQYLKKTFYIPYPGTSYPWVVQNYNEGWRPTEWQWAGRKEVLSYDQQNRIVSMSNCGLNMINYSYLYPDSFYPSKVTTATGSVYRMSTDNSGGLQSIETPLGFQFRFWLQVSLGVYRLTIEPAWQSSPVIYQLDRHGKIVSRKIGNHLIQYEREKKHKVLIRSENVVISESKMVGDLRQTIVESDRSREAEFTYQTVSPNVSTSSGNPIWGPSPVQINTKHKEFVVGNLAYVRHYTCKSSMVDYSVKCSGGLQFGSNMEEDVHNSLLTYETGYERSDHLLKRVNGFQIVSMDPQSVFYHHSENGLAMQHRLDIYGAEESLEIRVKDEIVFTRTMEYNCRGKLLKMTEKSDRSLASQATRRRSLDRSQEGRVTTYAYTDSGAIRWFDRQDSGSKVVAINFTYDANDNVQGLLLNGREAEMEYQGGERPVRMGLSGAVYEPDGGLMIARGNHKFEYNSLGRLTTVLYDSDTILKRIKYDPSGRVIEISDPRAEEATLFYYVSHKEPWQITHAITFSRRLGNSTTRLSYDRKGRLFSMETESLSGSQGPASFLVLTDLIGTPNVVFDATGKIVKDTVRTPFGLVFDDNDEDVRVPVGFAGGVDVGVAGIHIVRGRPYDANFGTWMVPDFDQLLQVPNYPQQVHLYRYCHNDPVNPCSINSMEPQGFFTLKDWLSFFNIDMDAIRTPILDPEKVPSVDKSLFPVVHLPDYLGMDQGTPEPAKHLDLIDPDVQHLLNLDQEERRPRLANYYQHKSPLLGPNIMIQRNSEGYLQMRSLEGSSSMETVLAAILNGAKILESDEGENMFILFKEKLVEKDVEAIKKYLPVDESEHQPDGRQLCVQIGPSRFCILIGLESLPIGT